MPEIDLTDQEMSDAVEFVSKKVKTALFDAMQSVIDGRPEGIDTPDKQYSQICQLALDKVKFETRR